MKKIINEAADFVPEVLDGLIKAHPSQLDYQDDIHSIVRADSPVEGKVALATGGGSGHLPIFIGYVGKGMLDGCAVGDVFSSPNADQMLSVTQRINGGRGVVYIYGNYGGDIMNFDMASEMAQMDDIPVRTVLVKDDVASAPPEESGRRRGVAGMVFAFKIAGAKADKGGSLDEVVKITERTLANTRTMGVALSPCIVPLAGKPTFTLSDDEMEIGMGIHGEPGMRREKMQNANNITERMTNTILEDLKCQTGDKLAIIVNGLGATPLEELYIMYGKVHQILTNKDISIHRAYVGEYATSMEMAGASLTFFRLDDELTELLDYPACTPCFTQI